jgi:hypothetical protein
MCFGNGKMENILNGTNQLPTRKSAPIKKSMINCLVGVCKSQMATLPQKIVEPQVHVVKKVSKIQKGGKS